MVDLKMMDQYYRTWVNMKMRRQAEALSELLYIPCLQTHLSCPGESHSLYPTGTVAIVGVTGLSYDVDIHSSSPK